MKETINTTGYAEALQNVMVYVLKEEGWYYSLNKKWSLTKQDLVDYYNDNLSNDYDELCDFTIGETPKNTTGQGRWYYCIEEYPLAEIIDTLVKSESNKIYSKVSNDINNTKKEIKKIIDNFNPLNK